MSRLEGQKFGKLTVLEHKRKNNLSGYLCKCECGNETWVITSSLTTGRTKSCGCSAKQNTNNIKMKNYIKQNYVENTNLKMIERAMNNIQNKNNSSGVKGVGWDKRLQKWVAYITVKKRRMNLGYYDDIVQAENARKEAEEKYFQPILDKYIKKD